MMNEQSAEAAINDATPSGESASVRDRLIEVAARHFADHGLQGASQRAIQREIGVNPASANYHFGTKEALYQAVIIAALDRIQPARKAGLEKVARHLNVAERLRMLMRAYIAPQIIEASTEVGYNYLRILAALHLAVPDAAVETIETQVQPVRELYVDQLSKMFPGASRNRIYEALRLCTGMASLAPMRIGATILDRRTLDKLIEDVVEICALTFETMCAGDED